MSANYDEQLEQSIAQYQAQRQGLVELQRNLAAVRSSATAPRQVVTVTVGSQGEIIELKFPTDAYKRMTPAELSSTIVATISEAREKTLDEVARLMMPTLPEGFSARDLVAGKMDLRTLLPEDPQNGADFLDGGRPGGFR